MGRESGRVVEVAEGRAQIDVIWDPRKKLWWGHPREGTERALSVSASALVSVSLSALPWFPVVCSPAPSLLAPCAAVRCADADPCCALPDGVPALLPASLLGCFLDPLLTAPPCAPTASLPDGLLCFLGGQEGCDPCALSSSLSSSDPCLCLARVVEAGAARRCCGA